MIIHTRLLSQQLAKPSFNSVKELISWMGAVQAQEYNMVKWAVGMRLKSPALSKVNEALSKGEILRTHVMRPTWHLVAAEDIRWMARLSRDRLLKTFSGYDKKMGITGDSYAKTVDFIVKLVEGNNHLTRIELEERCKAEGIRTENNHLNRFLMGAEYEGILCGGIEKNNKHTFALLDERVPVSNESFHKETALAKLAVSYFRSHSPASLQDFIWWSGLTATDAKAAIGSISHLLVKDKYESEELYVHESWQMKNKSNSTIHFLPPYDEYLISYKNRTHVLNLEHHPKAFTNYGIFYPVILYQGKVVGNWKKSQKKNGIQIETSFFDPAYVVDPDMLKKSESLFSKFLNN